MSTMTTIRAEQHISNLARVESTGEPISQEDAAARIRDARYGDHADLVEAIETLGETEAIRYYREMRGEWAKGAESWVVPEWQV